MVHPALRYRFDVLRYSALPMHCLQQFHSSTISHQVQSCHPLYDTSPFQTTAYMHQTHSHLSCARNNRSSLLCRILFLVLVFASRLYQLPMHAATLCHSEKNLWSQWRMATPPCSSASTGMLPYPDLCTLR